MNRLFQGIVSAFVCTLATSSVSADIFVPDGLSVGDTYHLVFTTQGRLNVNSSDINVYNDFVTAQAALSPLTDAGEWFAIASTSSIDARDNALVEAPVYTMDGTLVATGFADMWDGSLADNLNRNQFDQRAAGNIPAASVLTGSDRFGFASVDNGSFLNGGPLGNDGPVTTGRSLDSNSLWMKSGVITGNSIAGNPLRLYAMSQLLTVVPEPASLSLFALSGSLLFRRRRHN